MVALDPQTLSLVEGGERLRTRFGEQSRLCGLPLLLGWLNTASDFEYRFREANNKRLFVEICLMKMCLGTGGAFDAPKGRQNLGGGVTPV
jgi:DNA polymerase-3 subunit gamma/tau